MPSSNYTWLICSVSQVCMTQPQTGTGLVPVVTSGTGGPSTSTHYHYYREHVKPLREGYLHRADRGISPLLQKADGRPSWQRSTVLVHGCGNEVEHPSNEVRYGTESKHTTTYRFEPKVPLQSFFDILNFLLTALNYLSSSNSL